MYGQRTQARNQSSIDRQDPTYNCHHESHTRMQPGMRHAAHIHVLAVYVRGGLYVVMLDSVLVCVGASGLPLLFPLRKFPS